MNLRRYLRQWREFWQSIPARVYGSHIAETGDGITRLSALAPTVRPEDVHPRFRRDSAPLDYDVEPPPV